MLKPLLTLVALLFVTSQVTFAQEPTIIRVAGPPNEGYRDVFYGVQAGLFAKYGLDVQPRITNGGAVVLAGLAGGSFDVAYTNLVPVLQAHLHGLPFQIVAPSTMFMADRSQNAMLVTKDSPIRSARDLDGKTIGTQSLQDLNSVAMRAWIDKNGGNSSTIHVLEVPSASAVAALTSHRIDAMALSEPLLTMAIDTGKVRVLAKPQGAIAQRFQAQAFVATSDFVAAHPEAMARFAKAMHESAEYNNTHLPETIPMIAAFSSVPADVIAKTVRSIDGDYAAPRYIQPLIDFAAKYGMIPHTFPAEEIISPAALKSPK
jgi:NitT/TauT family transport system substrate-binding protein